MRLTKGKMTSTFFFDTYALIEIGKDNPHYELYREDVNILLSMLNLMELAYFLLREHRDDEIDEVMSRLSKFAVPYTKEILVAAVKMKYRYHKERLSYVDCIGYMLAKQHRAKFLTGDSKFKDKENVAFVK